MPGAQAAQTRPAPTSPFEAKPAAQPHEALAAKLALLGGQAEQAAAPAAEKVPAMHTTGAAPPPAQAMPAVHGVEPFVACTPQSTPAAHGVQLAAPAAAKEPAEQRMTGAPAGHALPAGQAVEPFVACARQ